MSGGALRASVASHGWLDIIAEESRAGWRSSFSEEPDLVELALERVLQQNGDIEVLRSVESRQALEEHGRIGALLRYAYSSPSEATQEEERSQHRREESERAHLEEKIDEALEETFPASDPPYWMPI